MTTHGISALPLIPPSPVLLSLVTCGDSGKRATPVTAPQTSEINFKGAASLSSSALVAGDGLPVPSDGVSALGHRSDTLRHSLTTVFTHGASIWGSSPLRQAHAGCSRTDRSGRAAVCNVAVARHRHQPGETLLCHHAAMLSATRMLALPVHRDGSGTGYTRTPAEAHTCMPWYTL